MESGANSSELAAIRFTEEGEGCVACLPGHTAVEKAVFAEFREHCGISSSKEFANDAKLLYKITIESGEDRKKAKPLLYLGVPHTAPFGCALVVCNRMFCKTVDASGEPSQGAFLLEGGFGVNPNKSAGSVFMSYGVSALGHICAARPSPGSARSLTNAPRRNRIICLCSTLMRAQNELTFHTKVDFSRLAFAR